MPDFARAQLRRQRINFALFLGPDSAVPGDSRIDNVVVPMDGIRHGGGMGLPALGRTLDVSQQEGDRATGKDRPLCGVLRVAPLSHRHARP